MTDDVQSDSHAIAIGSAAEVRFKAAFVRWYPPGGECPVCPDQLVEVVYAAGRNTGPAGLFDWRYRTRDYSVRSYRTLAVARQVPSLAPPLAQDHTGMRIDYRGILRQAREALTREPALAQSLLQLESHCTELGRRWYAGEASVVDEFLQLYCIETDARTKLADTPKVLK